MNKLMDMLKSPDPEIRLKAISKLSTSRQKEAEELLLGVLGDPDERVRATAAQEIVKIRSKEILKNLIRGLKSGNSHTKAGCALALGKLKAKEATTALIDALSVRDETVRRLAARALGEIGDRQAIQALFELLADRREKVRAEAAAALEKLGEPAGMLVLKGLEGDQAAIRELKCIKDPRVDSIFVNKWHDSSDMGPFSSGLNLGRPEVCRWARIPEEEQKWIVQLQVAVAHALGYEEFLPALINGLSSPSSIERSWSAFMLGKIKAKKAVSVLVDALSDEDYRVRAQVAFALGEIRDRAGVEPLLKALKDRYALVREAAAMALGKIGDIGAVDSLIEALDEPLLGSKRVRAAAAFALGLIGDPRALEPLRKQAVSGEYEKLQTIAEMALERILSLQYELVLAHPNLVCSDCFSRTEIKSGEFGSFGQIEYVCCRKCARSSWLVRARKVIGCIGGDVADAKVKNGALYVQLWFPHKGTAGQARDADINVLEIHDHYIGRQFTETELEQAISKFAEAMSQDRGRSPLYLKRCTLRFVGEPHIPVRAKQRLSAVFGRVECS